MWFRISFFCARDGNGTPQRRVGLVETPNLGVLFRSEEYSVQLGAGLGQGNFDSDTSAALSASQSPSPRPARAQINSTPLFYRLQTNIQCLHRMRKRAHRNIGYTRFRYASASFHIDSARSFRLTLRTYAFHRLFHGRDIHIV